ncbi:MAG TPA: T9SS type A sorting domain-containing protein [Saprospiraceae bacterium]|nr:T9SS type A sorting domain-containing protein [Saprospiraceae bacterium]
MKPISTIRGSIRLFIVMLVIWTATVEARPFMAVDTSCTANDLCETATLIAGVITDSTFVCIQGCNINATGDPDINPCVGDLSPTVWYKVTTDSAARLMNIQISSLDSILPFFVIFRAQNDCNTLTQIPLTQSHLTCAHGPNGIAEAFGTDVEPGTDYYIAVAGMFETQGAFELCLNMIEAGSTCVKKRNIVITSRTAGGSLSGPFYPGETIGICMNVDSFSAEENGCQWFQGIVPVFGNGWDPSSFDALGQPLNATINGVAFGVEGNGIYLTATWDWFEDVDYHYDHPLRQVGDFDNNGTFDMCNTIFDPDCPNAGGLTGGCCGPCWGAPLGDILPPGWFAYGINGSCPAPGPPIRLDWGDGLTCGGGMGPWKFCFELVIRDYPECTEDQSKHDLSLAFFTFADGETGSWTGNFSQCSKDQPAMLNLPLVCSNQIDLGSEIINDQCSGSTFAYTIEEPGVQSWMWSIDPPWAVINSVSEGANGFSFEDTLFNPSASPVDVTYFFTGFIEGSLQTVIKEVKFRIIPEIQSSLPDHVYGCELDTGLLVINAEPIHGGLPPYQYAWSPGGENTSSIVLLPPFQSSLFHVAITDSIGCTYRDSLSLHIIPCHLVIMPADTSNEMHDPDDRPIRKVMPLSLYPNELIAVTENEKKLNVFPIPASDFVRIEWQDDLGDDAKLIVMDARGQMTYQSDISTAERSNRGLHFNIKEYATGVYLVILQSGKTITSTKMMKM